MTTEHEGKLLSDLIDALPVERRVAVGRFCIGMLRIGDSQHGFNRREWRVIVELMKHVMRKDFLDALKREVDGN